MQKKNEYQNLLARTNLCLNSGEIIKGSFILLPYGYILWENIQTELNKLWYKRGIRNVALPSFIPLRLLETEKKHFEGFNPECFYVIEQKNIDEIRTKENIYKKNKDYIFVLRPTSETLFHELYRRILISNSYRKLPLKYNQWCSVFRSEKNTSLFFRSTEFYWQEGHAIHENEEESRQMTLDILLDYEYYVTKILNLAVIIGKKTEKEKFSGAIDTYTIEHLLPDGRCVQLATSHYFGDNFCRSMNVRFQNHNNQWQYPYSTSWGTSSRALGAITKTHSDDKGLILPFVIAPVQIAFILVNKDPELILYYQKILSYLSRTYRCRLYDSDSQFTKNALQADEDGCPLKIVLGHNEVLEEKITLIRRDKIQERFFISLQEKKKDNKEKKNSKLDVVQKTISESLLLLIEDFKNSIRGEKKISDLKEETLQKIRWKIQQNEICQVIEKEVDVFQRNIYQKSVEFRDNHIFLVNEYLELIEKIKSGLHGLFLVPFCNELECEKTLDNKVPSYSIRCISSSIDHNIKLGEKCFLCQSLAKVKVYLGRSY